jgi:hypothetical protein
VYPKGRDTLFLQLSISQQLTTTQKRPKPSRLAQNYPGLLTKFGEVQLPRHAVPPHYGPLRQFGRRGTLLDSPRSE